MHWCPGLPIGPALLSAPCVDTRPALSKRRLVMERGAQGGARPGLSISSASALHKGRLVGGSVVVEKASLAYHPIVVMRKKRDSAALAAKRRHCLLSMNNCDNLVMYSFTMDIPLALLSFLCHGNRKWRQPGRYVITASAYAT